MKNHLSHAAAIFCGLGLSTVAAFSQGSLTPPGAPAATMKSLDQIEARIPVDAIHTPGNANNLCVISQPGSYYLTTNLTAAGSKNGILITANNVALDLNGFTLLGKNGAGGGVTGPGSGGSTNVCVRNGSVQNWGGGGVVLPAYYSRFEALQMAGNGAYGLNVLGYCQVGDCTFTAHTLTGCQVGDGSSVYRCAATGTVNSTNGAFGFSGGLNCTFTGCVAAGNDTGFQGSDFSTYLDCTATGSTNWGFLLGNHTHLRDCSASGNGSSGFDTSGGQGDSFQGCLANLNGADGLAAGFEGLVTSCTASSNSSSGIVVRANGSVLGCTAEGNGNDGISTAFQCTVSGCTVAAAAENGINAGVGCTIVHCSVSGSGNTGINTGNAGTVTGCSAASNNFAGIFTGQNSTVSDCTASYTGFAAGGAGIAAGFRSTISGCLANGNQNDGIAATGGCLVLDCHASQNGLGTNNAAGIHATNGGNRLEGNQVRANSFTGILAGVEDLVLRNSLGEQNTNLVPVTLPMQTAGTLTNALYNIVF